MTSTPCAHPDDPGAPSAADPGRSQERAYTAASYIARERIRREDPPRSDALARVEESDIVIVRGCYDHVESVFSQLDLPYTLIDGAHLDHVTLRPEQLLIVNCPGHVSDLAIGRIRELVTAGGSLFTTDWALKHILEPAFPGLVEYNQRATSDDVVRIEVLDGTHRFLEGVMDDQADPLWWLEGSSYPIRVLDPDRVEVLLTSRELEAKYGEAPVAIRFEWGAGEVFHMISHYYLQRSELRSERHKLSAAAYAEASSIEMPVELAEECADVSWGQVEAAQSSVRFMVNVVADKKRRTMGAQSERTTTMNSRRSKGAEPEDDTAANPALEHLRELKKTAPTGQRGDRRRGTQTAERGGRLRGGTQTGSRHQKVRQ